MWNCPIDTKILKKYLIGITLSVQISSKLFDQKYVNLRDEFQVLSDFFILSEMVRPVTKVFWWLMKMKILWMLVVIVSQPASCCTASVLNLPPNISLRYFDWFLSVDHPDYKVLHHILDQCCCSDTRYKWAILTTRTKKIQIKILSIWYVCIY